MATPKFSKNAKLNALLTSIYEDLQELGNETIQHYKAEFPHKGDYNIVEYGNLLIYYHDIRKLYEDAGYKSVLKWSDERIWATYKRQVGYIARFHF